MFYVCIYTNLELAANKISEKVYIYKFIKHVEICMHIYTSFKIFIIYAHYKFLQMKVFI